MPHDASTAPLVTIGITLWNGQAFLREALDSLLGQDYRNLEIIILDNLSTDDSPAICREYAARDSRVRYVLDTQPRSVVEANHRTTALANGDYFMVACDDDVYEPTFVSRLIAPMLASPEIGLVYSGMDYVSPDGVLSSMIRPTHLMSAGRSRARNFMYYLYARAPVPISFGVRRTDLHRLSMPFYRRVDQHTRWDHDNLYMLRLLSLARVDSVADILFHYRQQDREALYLKRGQLSSPPGGFQRYRWDVAHELKVTGVVFQIIREGAFSGAERVFLRGCAVGIFLLNCTGRQITGRITQWLRQRSWWPQVRDRIRQALS